MDRGFLVGTNPVNSFSHAFRFLDRHPYFALGCALPDWLGAVDRRCRIRRKGAHPRLQDEDPILSNLAAGVIQHIDDDQWFHNGQVFNELNMLFAVELRELLRDEPGFRPAFLGHIIIELILDGYLHASFPGRLQDFYDLVEDSNPLAIQDAVCRMATKPTDKLAEYFKIFLRERYIFDYVDDERLIYRVNHVLQRVKLKSVGKEIMDWLPSCRQRVYDGAQDMLEPFELRGPLVAEPSK